VIVGRGRDTDRKRRRWPGKLLVPAQCLQVLAKLPEHAVTQSVRDQQQHRRLPRQRGQQALDDRLHRQAGGFRPRLAVPDLQGIGEASTEGIGLLARRRTQSDECRRRARQVVTTNQLAARPVDESAFAGVPVREVGEPG
jgi:hypothetical protein